MTTTLNNAFAAATTSNVRLFTTTLQLALALASFKGHQFIGFDAIYPQDKMNLTKRGDKSVRNPYLDKGLRKIARTQGTVSFDYETKVENRDGEMGVTEGNWQQAVILNGKLTPLSVHKGDIKTEPKPGAVMKDGGYKLADLRAVMDANNSVQFLNDSPRLYLRYEMQREGGEGERQDRKIRSESVYLLQDGTIVEKGELEAYLPPVQPRKDNTDMQTATLANIQEIRIGGETWRKVGAEDVAKILEDVKVVKAAIAANATQAVNV